MVDLDLFALEAEAVLPRRGPTILGARPWCRRGRWGSAGGRSFCAGGQDFVDGVSGSETRPWRPCCKATEASAVTGLAVALPGTPKAARPPLMAGRDWACSMVQRTTARPTPLPCTAGSTASIRNSSSFSTAISLHGCPAKVSVTAETTAPEVSATHASACATRCSTPSSPLMYGWSAVKCPARRYASSVILSGPLNNRPALPA